MKNKIILSIAIISTSILMLIMGIFLWVLYYDTEEHDFKKLNPDISRIDCHPSRFHQAGPYQFENNEFGWHQSCAINDGPFEAWKDNKVAIKGHYLNGKKDGKWIFYKENGLIEKEVNYKNGNLVKNNKANKQVKIVR